MKIVCGRGARRSESSICQSEMLFLRICLFFCTLFIAHTRTLLGTLLLCENNKVFICFDGWIDTKTHRGARWQFLLSTFLYDGFRHRAHLNSFMSLFVYPPPSSQHNNFVEVFSLLYNFYFSFFFIKSIFVASAEPANLPCDTFCVFFLRVVYLRFVRHFFFLSNTIRHPCAPLYLAQLFSPVSFCHLRCLMFANVIPSSSYAFFSFLQNFQHFLCRVGTPHSHSIVHTTHRHHVIH